MYLIEMGFLRLSMGSHLAFLRLSMGSHVAFERLSMGLHVTFQLGSYLAPNKYVFNLITVILHPNMLFMTIFRFAGLMTILVSS